MARHKAPGVSEHFNILEHDEGGLLNYIKNVIQGHEKNIDRYHILHKRICKGGLCKWLIKTSVEEGEANVTLKLLYEWGQSYDYKQLLIDLASQLTNIFGPNRSFSSISPNKNGGGVLVGYSNKTYWLAIMDKFDFQVKMSLYRCKNKKQAMSKVPDAFKVAIEYGWDSLSVSFFQKGRNMLYCMDAIQEPEGSIQTTSALCICAQCNKPISFQA